MKAFQISQYGDHSVLHATDIPTPTAAAGEVLVQLKAGSINPVDFKIRSGYLAPMLPKTFPFTLGWEGAGEIAALGEGVHDYQVGDAVLVMPNFMQGGTYAEYVVVNANEIMRKPANLDFATAATLPFSLGTAYTALVADAQIASGQRILIHGAGGAVGQMAVQIAKQKGLYVIGTATGANIQELKDLGIDEVIDYATTDFSTVAQDLDVVLDLVGGDTLAKSYALLRKGGTIVSTTQPPNPEKLAEYGLHGKMTQTRFNATLFTELLQWVENGTIQIKQPTTYPLAEAKEALGLVENRQAKGKMVLVMD